MNTDTTAPRRFDVPHLSDDETLRTVARHDATVERRRYDAAFVQGQADGYASGRAEVDRAIDDHRRNAQRLDALCSALEATMREVAGNAAAATVIIEEAVATMAMQIAEAVIAREVADRDVVTDSIRRCLQLRSADEPVVARVHPDDAACATEAYEAGLIVAPSGFTIVPDASVERGGCIVDIGAARLDSQIGAAVARVRAALLDS